MMIHAYQETYLSNAQSTLGEAFDYAVNDCDIPGDIFAKYFIVSSVSKKIENGEPEYLAGKSGIELVSEIIDEVKGEKFEVESQYNVNRTTEYWIGWAVAYYQWYSNRKYKEIFQAVPYEDLEKLYNTLHEADITKFVDVVSERVKFSFPETNLKRIRKKYGLTQGELAKRSGASIRSIQMYEQRKKNINKASVDAIYQIARVLGCSVEDLIEKG